MLNLAVLLEDSARTVPERDAIVCGESRMSYAAVNAAANRVANLLVHCGIVPGDKVALACPNVAYFPIVYYGILKAGAVVVPLNILLKSREIQYHLDDSDAKVFVCFEGTPDLPLGAEGATAFAAVDSCEHFILVPADPEKPATAQDPSQIPAIDLPHALAGQSDMFDTAATEPGDTAAILYTSGTTGTPKGAELTHASMLLNARLFDTMYDRVPHDVHLVTLPLFHTFAQSTQMNTGFYTRATLVLQPRFNAVEAVEVMRRENVTFFAGVPTMYWELLKVTVAEDDLTDLRRTLRYAVSGGAALPAQVLSAFADKYGIGVLEGYGLSETSPIVAFQPQDQPARPGSIGLPVWGIETRIVDEHDADVDPGDRGELLVRGHNVMKGYYGRPDATIDAIRDGWFHTGDIARRDDDGYLFIVDRKKDLIIRGGFNVYPREIEETLMTHPGVSLAAVIGVPHERHGEEVKAFIIPTPGSAVTESELVTWSKTTMAAHKYPRSIEIRDALPLGPTGKILKRALA